MAGADDCCARTVRSDNRPEKDRAIVFGRASASLELRNPQAWRDKRVARLSPAITLLFSSAAKFQTARINS